MYAVGATFSLHVVDHFCTCSSGDFADSYRSPGISVHSVLLGSTEFPWIPWFCFSWSCGLLFWFSSLHQLLITDKCCWSSFSLTLSWTGGKDFRGYLGCTCLQGHLYLLGSLAHLGTVPSFALTGSSSPLFLLLWLVGLRLGSALLPLWLVVSCLCLAVRYLC